MKGIDFLAEVLQILRRTWRGLQNHEDLQQM